MIEQLQKLRAEHAKELRRAQQGGDADDAPAEHDSGRFDAYRDSLIPQVGDDWLCAAEPVFVSRGSGVKSDSGWTVLVQERRSGVLAPLQGLWKFIVVGGLAAIGVVVLILTGLWGYVLIRLHVGEVAGQFIRRLTGMPTPTSQTMSARSEGSSMLSERSEDKTSGTAHG